MRKSCLLGITFFLTLFTATSDLVFGQACTANIAGGGGESWISIPSVATYDFGSGPVPLRKVEDLCAALTAAGATDVTISQHFHTNSEVYTWDCSASSCSSSSTFPESSCCDSACFCLDPEEGYEIHSTTTATPTILGTDVNTSVTIPGSYVASTDFGILLSVPCGASLKAEDVCVLAGLGPSAGTVTRFDPVTQLPTRHPCGNTIVNNFTLVSGEAILLQKFSAGDVPFSWGIGASPVVKEYCISGVSDGVGWSWWVDVGADAMDSASEPKDASAGPLSAGSLARDFATEFVSDINSVCPGIATPGSSNTCFQVTQPLDFDFWVGPSGGPLNTCKVTPVLGLGGGGCVFNPLIYLAVAGPGIPSISTIGYVILVLVLLAAGSFLLICRRRKTAAFPPLR